ncbi:hypothetical protein DVH05_013007 [Phytophthora capsici]|nr:hypothetical protein DVH05_013007 [Phytophthora capsici]
MSDTFATRSSDVPSSSSAGNASGDAPASATASSLQGGGDGTAVSPGGSSSAPAQTPASPRDTVTDTRNADPVVAAHEVPHMVSISDVDALLNRGLLTEVGTGASAVLRPDVPANWAAIVPRHEGPVFLVGVPARATDIRQGKHVSDSYGGPSCMVGYQYLSRDDVDELERVIPGFTEDDILRPRSMATTPRDLDASLGSITAQRELMSLLAHLPVDRLAERVFKTSGFLKIMASAHRRLREQVEAQGATAMIDAAAAQSRCDELTREWLFNCDFWYREVGQALSASDEVEKRLKSEMQDLKTRYQDHIDSLETDKAELKARLTDAEAHIRLLNDRPVTKAIDTWGFAEFLQKNADVSGNWDRLHELLELYQDNATVPSTWDTVINITSLDKRRDPVPDFKEAFDKAAAASSAVVTEKPPVVLDLTRPGASSKSGKSPPKSSKASSGKQPRTKSTGKSKLQKRSSPPKVQRRPSRHIPGKDSVRRAGEKTSVPKKSVHTMLPGNVVWKEVRPDLRQALLAGIKYEKAMDWLSSDRACHGLFREPQLVKMLVSMMYWRRLDATPWSSYVPEVYYKMADERLDRLLNLDQLAPSWEPLDAHVPYPDEDVESMVDDTTADPDFKAPPSDGSPSEDEDDGNDSDSGSESDGHTHKGSKRPRSQSSSDTDVPPPPSKKTKNYKRASSGHRRQLTTRRQVTKNPPSGSTSRRRSLSHKTYDSLTVDELQIVEVPDDSVLSWLHFGVRVQRVSISKSSLGQTVGFPEYEIHKHASELVKRRWDSQEYTALLRMDPTPWEYMFQNRIQDLHFHKRNSLSSAARELVDSFVTCMHKHAQAFWERTHWVTIDVDADARSADLYSQRAARRNALLRQYRKLVKESQACKTFPETLFYEPGIWTLSDKLCPWIWQDPHVADLGGPDPLDLDEQLEELDDEEPARTQWATALADSVWMKFVPDSLKQEAIPSAKRGSNPVTRQTF